jgi:hypothetical protein
MESSWLGFAARDRVLGACRAPSTADAAAAAPNIFNVFGEQCDAAVRLFHTVNQSSLLTWSDVMMIKSFLNATASSPGSATAKCHKLKPPHMHSLRMVCCQGHRNSALIMLV